jgi:hypothetical protein
MTSTCGALADASVAAPSLAGSKPKCERAATDQACEPAPVTTA